MRQEYDVIRSLTRYVALALGDTWDVREITEEGTLERPGAVIEVATPETPTKGSTAQLLELAAGYNIFIYPPLGTVPLDGRAIASRAGAKLSQALESGIDEGRQGLVPLYDYDGIGYDQDSAVRRDQDFAKLLDRSIRVKQSPDDDNRFTVLAEVRLAWKRDRLLPSNTRTTQSVRISFTS